MNLKFISTYASEQEYRADKTAYNYSLLADFAKMSPLGFKKKHITKEETDDDTASMAVGKLVHAKLANMEEDFERNFYISTMTKMPKPQEATFTEELFKLTLKGSVDGEFQGDFGEICQEAYKLAEIKTPLFPKLIENWTNNGGEEYYQELRNSYGKQIVTLEDLSLMERVISKARETQPEILNHKNQLNELPIKFEYNGKVFRCLIDRVNIYDETMVIRGFDWKVTYQSGEDDFAFNFLKNKYFYQWFLYQKAVEAWAAVNYPDYQVDSSFTYVALDDKGLYPTMVHNFSFSGWENPWVGFTHNGRTYKGLEQLIEELEWHKETGVWNSTKKVFENGGKCHHLIGS